MSFYTYLEFEVQGNGLRWLLTYSWCNQVLWSPQIVRKNTSRRWDLRLEVRSPIGGPISNWRSRLQLEMGPPIGGDTSDQRWDLQLEVRSLIGGGTSNWRWDLQLEVPMLHVGISYSFEKKRDYLLLITSSRHLSTTWNVNLFRTAVTFNLVWQL